MGVMLLVFPKAVIVTVIPVGEGEEDVVDPADEARIAVV